jgi:NAD(P)-dependent dehydrogenase (short-subunit alcohol dehydrogenase family)
MNVNYDGQRVLVTGGTRGIGKRLVEDFRSLGAEVFFTGRGTNSDTNYIQADFLDPCFDMELFLNRIEEENFDVCVNNAGKNVIAPIGLYPQNTWSDILELNLTVPFLITKHLSEGMATRKYGRIINITSISSEISMPLRSAYCSSKFGLVGLTKVSAVELASKGVLVNSVGPGVTETDLTVSVLGREKMDEIAENVPIGRLANVEDVSNVVMFMASSMNTYIVGQNIIVDGGYTCV